MRKSKICVLPHANAIFSVNKPFHKLNRTSRPYSTEGLEEKYFRSGTVSTEVHKGVFAQKTYIHTPADTEGIEYLLEWHMEH